jgi:hypothetical protein
MRAHDPLQQIDHHGAADAELARELGASPGLGVKRLLRIAHNRANRIWLDLSPRGDGAECSRHLQQSNLGGAERQARHLRQRRLHAHALCGVDDGGNPDFVAQLRGNGIDGMYKRVAQRHAAAKAPAIVLRLPLSDLGWLVDHNGLGRVTALQRRQVNEKLEQGPRLPPGLRGAIELTGFVIAATNHGQHGAVFCKGDESRLRDIFLRTFSLQPALDDAFGEPLQLQIQRRAKRQVSR